MILCVLICWINIGKLWVHAVGADRSDQEPRYQASQMELMTTNSGYVGVRKKTHTAFCLFLEFQLVTCVDFMNRLDDLCSFLSFPSLPLGYFES